jgi:hypothetical protein
LIKNNSDIALRLRNLFSKKGFGADTFKKLQHSSMICKSDEKKAKKKSTVTEYVDNNVSRRFNICYYLNKKGLEDLF